MVKSPKGWYIVGENSPLIYSYDFPLFFLLYPPVLTCPHNDSHMGFKKMGDLQSRGFQYQNGHADDLGYMTLETSRTNFL